ncbi:urease accessory protein UreD [Acidiplasma cupricumulans]|uniref:Urease accessory protein UreD n=1 Tax=Acidiplasma cupricumulans TaxID=312540 RepID=A0A0Q0VNT3_9ARCH|nr:urease accessory protein UreD [Acidiplasma cupricumulans]KQB35205.1 hypothetical protein AOG55_00590 [Acidiplasma cupricumulans]
MNALDFIKLKPEIFNAYEKEKTTISVGTPGKNAIVNLNFERYNERTYLTNVYNTIPARVVRELYYDEFNPEIPYIIFSNPTGGIVEGDRYYYTIHLGKNAEAFLTDSTATKIYKMDSNYASREIEIFLDENSRLEFLQKESIHFKNSRWYQKTIIHVQKNTKMLYSDIFVPGRVAMGEFWDFKIFSNTFVIEEGDDIILFDSSNYFDSDKKNIGIIFGNNKYLLNAYWYSGNEVKENISLDDIDDVIYGITKMPYNRGYFIRALSNNLDAVKNMQLKIWKNFREKEVNKKVPFLRIY